MGARPTAQKIRNARVFIEAGASLIFSTLS
jgi:hypothetical protein